MKNAIPTTAGVCLFVSAFLVLPLPKGAAYPFPIALEWIRMILAIPVVVCATFIFIVSLRRVMSDRGNSQWVASLLITTPQVILFAILFLKSGVAQKNSDKFNSWPQLGMYLRDQLLSYAIEHPEKFEYVGSSEEVIVSGFAEYLQNRAPRPEALVWDVVKIKDNQVIDPWGDPVRYGMDRNHDGYIIFDGRRHCTDHTIPPCLDYQTAVLVRLGLPKGQEGGVGPHVARRFLTPPGAR